MSEKKTVNIEDLPGGGYKFTVPKEMKKLTIGVSISGRPETRKTATLQLNFEEYTLVSNYALDQINKLAEQLSEANFIAITIKIFGSDIPLDAYKKLYQNLSDNSITTLDIEVQKEKVHDHDIAYNNQRNIIYASEAIVKEAIDNNEKRAELLVALTEEFGHHIDYLLRNEYSNVGGDAKNDEGAVFAYQVFDINLMEIDSVEIGEVTSPDYSGKLMLDLSKEHTELKEFVNQQAQLDDGKSPDGEFEFFNAGLLEHGYGHENIDRELRKIGFIEGEDLPHVYLGNWLRDYSQLILGSTIRLSEQAQVQLKKRIKDESKLEAIYQLHSGKLSRDGLTNLVGIMAAHEFIYVKNKHKWNEYNALECRKQFEDYFGTITPEILGCYRPEEHIDNPKGLEDETYIDPDFFIGCDPKQLQINFETGQKRYILESFEPKRPSPRDYIKNKLLFAAKVGRTSEGLREFGAAMHVLEDFFAHTNFVELSLIKLVNDKVYAWVEEVEEKGYNVNSLQGEKLLHDPGLKVVQKPYKSTQKNIKLKASVIPLVSGVFDTIDTLATVTNKLRHMIELPDFNYVPPKPGQRTFSDLVIVTLLEDMAKGQKEDAAQKNGNYKGADYAYYLDLYKDYVLGFRDFKSQKIQEGGFTGGLWEFIDRAGESMATIITYPYTLALNILLQTIEASIKEYETFPRNFGTNPTHTQLSKDDPAHPIHDLAGKLAVEAVKKVGLKLRDTWRGIDTIESAVKELDEIMSHPCKTDWMDDIVIEWATAHPKEVKKLEKSSYLEIAKEQQETFLKNLDELNESKDETYKKMMKDYEK